MSINQSFSRNQSLNKSKVQTPVYLNIYNFWSCFNKTCGLIGVNVYHTGIQIFDDQYLFFGFDGDETGVGFIQPYTAAYQFSQQILLGYTHYSYFQFDEKILDPLREQFTGNKYDLLNNNCNHFSKRLADALNVGNNFPSKVFSVTNFFNSFRCCIPNCILNGRLDWFQFDEQKSFQSDGYPQGYKQLNQEIHKKSRQSSRLKIIVPEPDKNKEQVIKKYYFQEQMQVNDDKEAKLIIQRQIKKVTEAKDKQKQTDQRQQQRIKRQNLKKPIFIK